MKKKKCVPDGILNHKTGEEIDAMIKSMRARLDRIAIKMEKDGWNKRIDKIVIPIDQEIL